MLINVMQKGEKVMPHWNHGHNILEFTVFPMKLDSPQVKPDLINIL